MIAEPKNIDAITQKIRNLANSSEYRKAYLLAKKMRQKYPQSIRLIYHEAVMYGDDEQGRGKKEVAKRHRKTALMFKPLLCRLRSKGIPPRFRHSIRNEYYWFSHQPFKQYRLGCEGVKKGVFGAQYSQGVGAVELAKMYFDKGKFNLGDRWSKIAEKAWKEYFKIVPNWYNAYYFYAKALGFQGKLKEAESALRKAAKISGKPIKYELFENVRKEIHEVFKSLKI